MADRHHSGGYDPAEPCRPLSQVVWSREEYLIEPEWRTETVLGLAANIRETRDFSILPILADALQDAGCDNQYVLNHCRVCEKHHYACWVVSAVLMKPPKLKPGYISRFDDTGRKVREQSDRIGMGEIAVRDEVLAVINEVPSRANLGSAVERFLLWFANLTVVVTGFVVVFTGIAVLIWTIKMVVWGP